MRDDARKAIHAWLTKYLGERMGVLDLAGQPLPPEPGSTAPNNVIAANQNAPRPKLPFMTMFVNGWRKIGHDQTHDPDEEGYRWIFGVRQFSVSLQVFGPGAFETLELIQSLLEEDRALESLRTAGIVVYDSTAIVDVSAFLETGAEERAAMDLICRASVERKEAVGTIETISGEATLDQRVFPFHGPPENE